MTQKTEHPGLIKLDTGSEPVKAAHSGPETVSGDDSKTMARLQSAINSQKEVIKSQRLRIEDLEKMIGNIRSEYQVSNPKAVIESLERENTELRKELQKTKNTIAFQLGQTLLKGFKSPKSIIALPRSIYAIHREARRRKARNKDKPLPINIKQAAQLRFFVSNSNWLHPFRKIDAKMPTIPKETKCFSLGNSINFKNSDEFFLTPSNYTLLYPINFPIFINLYLNKHLYKSEWGNLFDFDEMQNFKKYLEIREIVKLSGGSINIEREDSVSTPLLKYLEN